MVLNRDFKTSFSKVSDSYDSARPSYPDALVSDVVEISGISARGRILDVGCGTGKATVLFAKKGFQVTGLDISSELLDVAKKASTGLAGVDFVLSTFEEAVFPPRSFELVISAQAFHWVDPEVGYSKASYLLKSNSWMALFWNLPDLRNKFNAELREMFLKYCPTYNFDHVIDEMVLKADETLIKTGLFSELVKKTYSHSRSYSLTDYLALVNTYSHVIALAEEERMRLFEEIKRVFGNHASRPVPYTTILLMARKP